MSLPDISSPPKLDPENDANGFEAPPSRSVMPSGPAKTLGKPEISIRNVDSDLTDTNSGNPAQVREPDAMTDRKGEEDQNELWDDPEPPENPPETSVRTEAEDDNDNRGEPWVDGF